MGIYLTVSGFFPEEKATLHALQMSICEAAERNDYRLIGSEKDPNQSLGSASWAMASRASTLHFPKLQR